MTGRIILLGVTADVSLGLMSGYPEHLVAAGWDVHVVSSAGPALARYSLVPGITTHEIDMAREPSVRRDLVSLVKWIKLFRHLRPEVVSVGTPKAGLLASIAGWITRVPNRVYLLRGLRLESAHGPRRHLLIAMERLAMTLSHTVLAVGDSLRDRAIHLRLTSPEKLKVVGAGSSNGVNLDRFSSAKLEPSAHHALREQLGMDTRAPVIGFVGRLTVDKGLDVLADALADLSENNIEYQLLIVGEPDDALAETILARIRSIGPIVTETGRVEETAPFYPLMDVLCLPTKREGFPNVVLEASACGIPTITTDATGAVDAVVDRKTGLVVPSEDARSLARGLTELLGDSGLRSRLGKQARLLVERDFEQSVVWENLTNFYSEHSSDENRAKRVFQP